MAKATAKETRSVRRPLRRRAGFWATVMTFALLLGGAVYLYMSPVFRVHEIQVEGAAPALWQRIRDESGLDGESMVRLDLAEARARLSTAIPAIKDIEFERKLPDTIIIRVTERQPWGYWEANNHLFTIDEDGVVLDHDLPDLGAPVIRQLGALAPQAGDRVDPEIVHLAARLQEVLPGAIGESAAEFLFDPLSGLTVTTNGGKEIVLGSPSAADYKIAVLQAAAQRAAEEGIQYTVMDLSHGERAILR